MEEMSVDEKAPIEETSARSVHLVQTNTDSEQSPKSPESSKKTRTEEKEEKDSLENSTAGEQGALERSLAQSNSQRGLSKGKSLKSPKRSKSKKSKEGEYMPTPRNDVISPRDGIVRSSSRSAVRPRLELSRRSRLSSDVLLTQFIV